MYIYIYVCIYITRHIRNISSNRDSFFLYTIDSAGASHAYYSYGDYGYTPTTIVTLGAPAISVGSESESTAWGSFCNNTTAVVTHQAPCASVGSESESTWGTFCNSMVTPRGYTAAAVMQDSCVPVMSGSESGAWSLLGNGTATDMFDAAFEDQTTLAELYGILGGRSEAAF